MAKKRSERPNIPVLLKCPGCGRLITAPSGRNRMEASQWCNLCGGTVQPPVIEKEA